MSLKDVSFWCVVLVIVTAMTIQHILSINIIEGNVDGPNIELTIITKGGEEDSEEDGASTKDLERQNKILKDQNKQLTDKNKELKQELISSEKRESEIAASAEIKEEPSETPEAIPESTPEPTPPPRIELTPDDYNEHYYEINTCGKEGKDPPKEKECKGSLDGKWFNKGVHNYDQNNGIHKWVVPRTGSYIIEAAGGIGGSIKDAEENGIVVSPGKGAIMKGIFYLKQGEEYNIIIGQNGTEPKSPRANPWNGGAGAGGGTFMWQKGASKPLIVAGGGGGQGIAGHKMLGYGGDGSVTERGTMGPIVKRHFDIPPPMNIVPNFGRDGEGGGDPAKPLRKSKGWNSILKNEPMTGVTNVFQSESGFGGGGMVHTHAGGGGGGYSGGGSKRYGYSESNTLGGGGGGSYFDDDGFKREDSMTLDFNDDEGGGYLKIEYIREYFFAPGTKHRCRDVGGYEPKSQVECKKAAKTLGLEYKIGPRENGWNNDDCKSGYSRCIWREETIEEKKPGCEKNNNVDKGLVYNRKCNGTEGYKPKAVEEFYKTICVTPWKREQSLD